MATELGRLLSGEMPAEQEVPFLRDARRETTGSREKCLLMAFQAQEQVHVIRKGC